MALGMLGCDCISCLEAECRQKPRQAGFTLSCTGMGTTADEPQTQRPTWGSSFVHYPGGSPEAGGVSPPLPEKKLTLLPLQAKDS